MTHDPTYRNFEILAATLPGQSDVTVAIAASRAGACGVLNLEHAPDVALAQSAVHRLARFGRGALGVKLAADDPRLHALELPPAITVVIFATAGASPTAEDVARVRVPGRRILVECTTLAQAQQACAAGADGIVAKGHEAGGYVADETTFILVQRLLAAVDRPVWAFGGIGLHSAAACYVAGCAGVMLDVQLALADPSAISPKLRSLLARMEGDETVCIGGDVGVPCRVYRRPGTAAIDALQQLELSLRDLPADEARSRWRNAIAARVGWTAPESDLWPLGQDAAFAAGLARRFKTVAGILDGLRAAVAQDVTLARQQRALDRHSALAQAHGTEYPILQGPMTRVSDTSAFAAAVAQNGALPFLALALLRKPQVRELLESTRALIASQPWGVGILGFVPLELRQEQLEVVRAVRPAFAIIAGGRPDQAARLEADGITTYLHVPAPGLLRMFLEDGARRFIFEGRECGGHVGPRTSFVLWQTMIETLLEAIDRGIPGEQLHIVFAGGIHDARSSAMVAAMAAPLVARGVRIGVLLGTAYLFTEEIVGTRAIVETFQREALDCRQTVLLESGPGHSTRCAETPFCETFQQTRRRLVAEGKSAEEIKGELEDLNLGRLRIASKGLTRDPGAAERRLIEVDPEQQRREGMFMIGQLAALRTRVCRMSELHESVSTESVGFLLGVPQPTTAAARVSRETVRPCDVAIIGLGCVLPKAQDVQTFWGNVLKKVDAITEVPKDRFDVDRYYDPDKKAPDRIYSRWGGFLDDLPFDPLRYGIPPASLPSIDPLQLLALEGVRQALADAGYLDREYARDRTSVILGLSGGLGDLGLNYGVRSTLPMLFDQVPGAVSAQLPDWTEDSFPGLLLNVVAGRVANRFDLGGVNYAIDAACASSLAAVYAAASELDNGTSDMVIVGGVDTAQNPFGFLCFSKAQALSPRGRCRTFDASADGIAISEGLSVLVLKRLADAERDGDRIYAVIKAVAGSSDGRGRSLTAPRPEGQTVALERAYARAGISPATVGLIEAHGTGTVVGDGAEVAALASVFEAAGAAPATCAIGSVKSMVGHTKAAAGVTGMLKVALALHHKVLPPTLHVTEPNPQLRKPGSPFFVNTNARPWLANELGTPRRAGVSSFGFGGTNFHAVVEEYVDDYADPLGRKGSAEWPAELFVWSADSSSRLDARLTALEQRASSEPSPQLRALAASVCADQAATPAADALRLAIVACDVADLRTKVAGVRAALKAGTTTIQDAGGIYLQRGPRAGKLALLFAGQGSQMPHMLRDLAVEFPHFHRSCEEADRVLQQRLPRPLSSYIFPPPAFAPDEQAAQMRAITDTVVAQPALGAVEIGLFHLLRDLGVEADMVAGHSFGEYVALAASGVIPQEQLFVIAHARGRAITDSVGDTPGTMAAVGAEAERVAAVIESVPGVWIANINAPRQTIVAGAPSDVERGLRALESAGMTGRAIPVACAFHSPLMEPARARLADALARLEFAAPTMPVFSNTRGGAYPTDPADIAALLSEHLVQPVKFVQEIEAMYEAGARLFLEVGPKSVLTALTRQILDGRDAAILATDVADRHGVVQLLHVLGQLSAFGVALKLDTLFQGRSVGTFDETPAARPAATWLINGARCRPTGTPKRVTVPVTLEIPDRERSTTVPQGRSEAPGSTTNAASAVQPGASAAPARLPVPAITPTRQDAAPMARGASASDAVLLEFQGLMSRFLETQAAIMGAYLGGTTLPQQAAHAAAPAVQIAAPRVEVAPQDVPVPQPRPQEVPSPVIEVTAVPSSSATGSDAAAPVRDIGGDLLRIVAERTGYPSEMLDLDRNIEADLGIDSIKRVEILSAFQRLGAADERAYVQRSMERLSACRTLREVIHALTQAARDAEPATEPLLVATEPDEPLPAPSTEETPRVTFLAVDAPIATGAVSRFPGRLTLITDDEQGLAETVAAHLRQNGERAVVLRLDTSVGRLGQDCYGVDLTRADQVSQVLDAVARTHGTPGAILHLLPLRPDTSFDDLTFEAWQRRVQTDVKSLYGLIRATMPALTAAGRGRGATILGATALGPALVGTDHDLTPSHGGIAALLKTVAVEVPDVACRAVHLDASDPAATLAAHIAAELGAVDDERVEACYAAGRRQTLAPRLTPLDPATERDDLGPDSVILVTGGARGITAEISRHLAATYHPTLVLAGRSPLAPHDPPGLAGIEDPRQLKASLMATMRAADPGVRPADVEAAVQRVLRDREIRRNVQAIGQAGARVEYNHVDVRDDNAFAAFIQGLYARHGRLDAVVHGAGVIEDRLLKDKSPDSFDRVVQTKTDSAFTLLRALRPDDLKVLVFMSSVSASFGNRGQADYGAANGVLNALAAMFAARWRAHVCAINWGPWDKTGMVTDEVRRQFAARGIQVIPPAAGVDAFAREIASKEASAPVAVVGGGPWAAEAAAALELETFA